MKKLMLMIAAFSFAAATASYAQSADQKAATTNTPNVSAPKADASENQTGAITKSENASGTPKSCCKAGASKSCCKSNTPGTGIGNGKTCTHAQTDGEKAAIDARAQRKVENAPAAASDVPAAASDQLVAPKK